MAPPGTTDFILVLPRLGPFTKDERNVLVSIELARAIYRDLYDLLAGETVERALRNCLANEIFAHTQDPETSMEHILMRIDRKILRSLCGISNFTRRAE